MLACAILNAGITDVSSGPAIRRLELFFASGSCSPIPSHPPRLPHLRALSQCQFAKPGSTPHLQDGIFRTASDPDALRSSAGAGPSNPARGGATKRCR